MDRNRPTAGEGDMVMLTLHHGRTSVCSIKARLALAEKGVPFDSKLRPRPMSGGSTSSSFRACGKSARA